ncbi:MAG TPA: IS1595 family transposase [Candidatus Micrarchaeaceae archaeon]|nr:IS1595 family transposase [Candidatus Micrarchaeaceae archaeon]
MNSERFPETLLEAVRYFSDEAVCRDFMSQLRWPDGVVCPRCEAATIGYVASRSLWRCKACKYEFTVKKGTIFEDSPIPLSKWLPALWMYSSFKKGVSSHQLAKNLGVTQKSAWFMAHRIRLAMEIGNFEAPLSGEVEVDETFVGGLAKFQHENRRKHIGTGASGKTIVMGLLERNGDVRAKIIPSRRRGTVHAQIRASIAPGSTIYSDALPSYAGLDSEYVHGVIDHAQGYVRDRIHTNGIENFWSLFKRMIYGTHHSVDPEHLDRYLAEATTRFNGRKASESARFASTTSGVIGKRITYRQLIGKDAIG